MGAVVAFLLIGLVCAMALSKRPVNALYALLFLIVFFEELGPGFTSFTGSFLFNQSFLNLFKLKLIEPLMLAVYLTVLFTYKRQNPSEKILVFDKWLALVLGLLIFSLSIVGIANGHGLILVGWRLIVSGAIFFHLMYILLDDQDKLYRFAKLFLAFLAVRAAIGLLLYAAGHGVVSPRGNVPFFWDSRQVGAFSLGIIMVVGLLTQYRSLPPVDRMLPKWLLITILIVLTVTVLLSIRRTVWAYTLIGSGVMLLTARRLNVAHYSGIAGAIMVALLLLLTLPQTEGFRIRMGVYIESLNLLDTSVAKQQENAVHIDNIEEYTRIIFSDPALLFFGVQGRKGSDFRNFSAEMGNEFILGKAHNGPLRTLLIFGLGGLFIYLAFYIHILSRANSALRIPDTSRWLWISKASLIFLALQLGSALTFVPPFYTSFKGLAYTFIATYFLYAGLYYSARWRNRVTVQSPDRNTQQSTTIIPRKPGSILSSRK